MIFNGFFFIAFHSNSHKFHEHDNFIIKFIHSLNKSTIVMKKINMIRSAPGSGTTGFSGFKESPKAQLANAIEAKFRV